jgi:hypothetical protein
MQRGPRPPPSASASEAAAAAEAPPTPAPAELDQGTRELLADVIARAIATQLGHVRISSIPPSEPAPRSSMRVAAQYTGKGIKWGVFGSGALSLLGSAIVWVMRPEYAAPLGQALKLIAGVIVAAVGGGAPARDVVPPRDVPAIIAPAPNAPAPDAAP